MKVRPALLVLLMLGAGIATAAVAQPTVPYVQVFFDEALTQEVGFCPP